MRQVNPFTTEQEDSSAYSKLSDLKNNPWSHLLLVSLKGIAQVIFIENAFSGLLILAGIFVSSISLGMIAFLSACIATLIGKFGGASKTMVNQGLLSFNSVLAGMALFMNLTGEDRWIIALAGAAVTTILTAAMQYWLRNAGIPAFTFPFIITTWLFLLSSYRLPSFHLNPQLAPTELANKSVQLGGPLHWLNGIINGVGEVYFMNHVGSGLLIIAGIFWASRRLGVYAVIGSAMALLIANLLGGDHASLNDGLYGYNAVLTILATGAIFDAKNRWAPVIGAVAAVITVPITASISSWLLPYGLPTLTLPFVLCSWVFLAARKVLPKL